MFQTSKKQTKLIWILAHQRDMWTKNIFKAKHAAGMRSNRSKLIMNIFWLRTWRLWIIIAIKFRKIWNRGNCGEKMGSCCGEKRGTAWWYLCVVQEADGLHHPGCLLRFCVPSSHTYRSNGLIAEKRKTGSYYWKYDEKGKSREGGHSHLCINLITLKNLKVILYSRALD